jgi:hypothetical protein
VVSVTDPFGRVLGFLDRLDKKQRRETMEPAVPRWRLVRLYCTALPGPAQRNTPSCYDIYVFV